MAPSPLFFPITYIDKPRIMCTVFMMSYKLFDCFFQPDKGHLLYFINYFCKFKEISNEPYFGEETINFLVISNCTQ